MIYHRAYKQELMWAAPQPFATSRRKEGSVSYFAVGWRTLRDYRLSFPNTRQVDDSVLSCAPEESGNGLLSHFVVGCGSDQKNSVSVSRCFFRCLACSKGLILPFPILHTRVAQAGQEKTFLLFLVFQEASIPSRKYHSEQTTTWWPTSRTHCGTRNP